MDSKIVTRKKYETFNKQMASVVFANVQDTFFSFSKNISQSETTPLLLRIILESFKLHYFLLTSNTCSEYSAVRTQILLDASLTWMPETLVSSFGHSLQ